MKPLETPEAMADRLQGCRSHEPGRCPSAFYAVRLAVIREDRRVIAEAAKQKAAEYEINGYGPEAGAIRAFALALRGEP